MATLVAKTVDPGGTGQYTTHAACEAANYGASNANLTVSDEYCVTTAICTNGAADTSAVTISGQTTDATRNITFTVGAAYRTPGLIPASGNYYRMVVTGAVILVVTANVTIFGVPITMTTSADSQYAIRPDGDKTRIDSCVITITNAGTHVSACGIRPTSTGTVTSYVSNTVVYGFKTINYNAGINIYPGGGSYTCYVYNCTVYDCIYGIGELNSTVYVKNNIATSCTYNYSNNGGFNAASTNNIGGTASELAFGATRTTGATTSATAGKLNDTGKNFTTLGVRVGSVIKNTTDTTYTYVTAVDSTTVLSVANNIFANGEGYAIYYNLRGTPTFYNAGAGDYHLVAGASNIAYQTGADLDQDANLAVTTDIDGQARHATTPCIGADESGIYDVACADGVVFGDTTACTITTSQACADGVKFSDSPINTITTAQAAVDGVKFSDSPINTITMAQAAVDGVNYGDATSGTAMRIAAATDGVKFGDSPASRFATTQAAAEELIIADAPTGGRPTSSATADGVKFGESVSATSATTVEFVWTIDTGGTGQYTSMSAWEATGLGIDFTVATVKVFSHSGIVGGLALGTSVVGTTSGATGIVHGITASQILLRAVSGTFQVERIQKVGDVTKYVTATNSGSPAACKARLICTNGAADTTRVSYGGTTTSPTNYVLIETDLACFSSDPFPTSGNYYRLDTTYAWGLFIDDENITINRLSMRHTASADTCYGIQCIRGPTRLKKVRLEFVSGAYTTGRGISFVNASSGESGYASNCIVSGVTGANSRGFTTASTISAYFYSCLAVGNDTGFNISSGTAILKNCISVENVTDYAGTANGASTHNGYSTAALTGDVAPINLGTNETLTFVNYAAGDYHIKALATDLAFMAGADIDHDTDIAVTDDITGRARHATTPCLGPYEAIVQPAATSDGVKFGDAPANVLAGTKAATDGVKLSDTPGRVMTAPKAAVDGFTVGETTTAYTAVTPAAATDGVVLADSTARTVLAPKAATEGLVLTDSTACTAVVNKAAVDGVKFGDSTAKTANRRAVTADGVKLGDSTARAVTAPKVATDGVKLSDSAVGRTSAPKAATDGVKLSDAPDRTAQATRVSVDGVVLGDSSSALSAAPDSMADGIVLGDSASVVVTWANTAADGVKFGETVTYIYIPTGGALVEAAAADGVTLGDSPASLLAATTSATDGATLSEALSGMLVTSQAAADGVAYGDTLIGISLRLATIADGILYGDLATYGGVYVAESSDGIAFSDVANRIRNHFSAAVDGIVFTDADAAIATIIGAVIDAMKLSDAPSNTASLHFTAQDGIKLSDAVARARTRYSVAADGVKFGDYAYRIKVSELTTGTVRITVTATRPTVVVTGR